MNHFVIVFNMLSGERINSLGLFYWYLFEPLLTAWCNS